MATSQAVLGLIEQLGLGPRNETEAYNNALNANTPQYSNSQGGDVAKMYSRLGQQIGGGIRTGIEHYKQRGDGDSFGDNMRQAQGIWKDEFTAKGLGITGTETESAGEVLRKQRQTRQEVGQINVPVSGDDFKDQSAFLDEVTKIAQRNGDSDLAMKASAMRNKLRQDELNWKDAQSDYENQELGREKEKTEEIPIIRKGSNPNEPGYRNSWAIYDEDEDTYHVTHPNGEQEDYDTIRKYEKSMFESRGSTGAASGSGISQDLQHTAANAFNGLPGKRAAHNQMESMRGMVDSVTGAVDLLDTFVKPEAIMSWSGSAVNIADKSIKFADNLWELSTGQKIGDGTYSVTLEDGSTRTLKGDQYAYNGRVVSEGKQRQLFSEAAKSMIQELPIPTEMIAELGIGASQWQAMIMEMAYADARLQEPSNRGLSDNDIKAALKRIGAYSANPVAFFERQIEVMGNTLKKLNRVGDQISDAWIKDKDTGQPFINWTREQIVDHVYNGGQEFPGDPNSGYLNETKNAVQEALVKLQAAKEKHLVRQRESMGLEDEKSGTELSDEELAEKWK